MNVTRTTTATLLAGLASALAQPADADPPTVAEVIANVRRATGVERLAKHPTGIHLIGSGSFLGNDVTASLLLDSAGRYVRRYAGPVPFTAAFNGKDAWSIEFGGAPRVLAFDERAVQVIMASALTGFWLSADAPLRFELDAAASNDQTVLLLFQYCDGHERGSVEIAKASWLPQKWVVGAGAAKRTLVLNGAREFDGMTFPVRISEETAHGASSAIEIEKIAAAPNFIRSPYDPLPASAADVMFDPAIAAALEVERARTGHLLVKPRVNGREIGWFIFDTGAGSSVISSEKREELSLKQIAKVPAVGVGGAVLSPVFRLEQFRLGPVALNESLIIELDLKFLEAPLGRPIAGVLGYEFISRCVTEIDLAAGRIALHDPESYQPHGAEWTAMKLSSRVPVVDARFEGHTYPIRLDTGASGGGVLFHHPIVEKLKLLDGRETTLSASGGVGGSVPTRIGKLKWLELGGQRIEDLDAGFVLESKGAFNDHYTAGVVGASLLSRFRLILDYPHQRIAFQKRAKGE